MRVHVAGLRCDGCACGGFRPRSPGGRARLLAEAGRERRALVYFGAPHRTASTLAAMALAFGADRRAAVCRELTKTYEEVRRGPLCELAAWAEEGVLGEVTIVVAGFVPGAVDLPAALAQVQDLVHGGMRLKDACAEIGPPAGLSKKLLYDAVLAAR